MLKIGITEAFEPCFDFSWVSKLQTGTYDGAILITKHANQKFINHVIDLYRSGFHNLILHLTCTGWGGTWLEPGVPEFHTQLNAAETLINYGFPADHIVLRIDPIIPTNEGLQRVKNVLDTVITMKLPISRFRFSIMDEYKHVKQRLLDMGKQPFYDGFYPTWDMTRKTAALLRQYPQFTFESCAEDRMRALSPNIICQGCVSTTELNLFQLPIPDNLLENMQNRKGCHCLSCKRELLSGKKQCPHQCVYCYWRN